jgi:hypothetical protein
VELGGGTVVVRLHGTAEDEARRFNRTENIRPIAPTDPDFAHLFRQRNDAESINRALEDTMYLRRAHSRGPPASAREARIRAGGTRSRSFVIDEESRAASRSPPDSSELPVPEAGFSLRENALKGPSDTFPAVKSSRFVPEKWLVDAGCEVFYQVFYMPRPRPP